MTVSSWQRPEERTQSRGRGAGNVPRAVLTKGAQGSDPDAATSREQKAPDRIGLPHGAQLALRCLQGSSHQRVLRWPREVLRMERERSPPVACPQAVRMASLPLCFVKFFKLKDNCFTECWFLLCMNQPCVDRHPLPLKSPSHPSRAPQSTRLSS